MAGAVPVEVIASKEQSFKITAEQLEAAITPKTKMFMLNSPSNPTGIGEVRAVTFEDIVVEVNYTPAD